MFATVRAGAPRSTVYVGWSLGRGRARAAPSPSAPGGRCPWPARPPWPSGRGVGLRGRLRRSAGSPARRRPRRRLGARLRPASPRLRGRLLGRGGRGGLSARPGRCRWSELLPLPVPDFLKYATQVGSTLPGSRCELVVHLLDEPLVGSEVGGGVGCDEVGSDGLVCCCGTGAFASSGTCAWMSGSDSRLVPHARKYRSTVARWCKVYPIGVTGRGRALRRAPRSTPTPDRKGTRLASPPPALQRHSGAATTPRDPPRGPPGTSYRGGRAGRSRRARARRLRRQRLVDAGRRIRRSAQRREPADGDRGHDRHGRRDRPQALPPALRSTRLAPARARSARPWTRGSTAASSASTTRTTDFPAAFTSFTAQAKADAHRQQTR